MARESLNDLVSFVTVAQEKSFTRAAALLGVSQSALSHSIRGLESRLGVRLLTRTTRSVSVKDVGEKLLATLAPRLDEIWQELDIVSDMREKPAGTVRITATDFAIKYLLWPKLIPLLTEYPGIKLELMNEYALTDIVANRYDAGVRLGEQINNGMISVRIGPDINFVAVGSPSYFSRHPFPKAPQDLVKHSCINLRLSTHGGLYAWEFQRYGHPISVKVEGQLVFNDIFQVVEACVAGFGIAFVPYDIVARYISTGRLISVMKDYCPTWDGYHLYYPSRRQSSVAMKMVVKALRHQ